MDIKSIKTFVRVAELKSFTKAANEMNYVQSTVTMQIKQLEKELGYPLFDRIGKKVSLTFAGSKFITYAYDMLKIVSDIENISDSTDDISGKLRIGVTESLMFGVLIDLLPIFKEQYKNIELSFKTGHTSDLIEELKHNDLDLIYISKSINTESELNCYYKKEEKMVFLSSSKHHLARENSILASELFKNNFIVTEKEGICFKRLSEIAAKKQLYS